MVSSTVLLPFDRNPNEWARSRRLQRWSSEGSYEKKALKGNREGIKYEGPWFSPRHPVEVVVRGIPECWVSAETG